MKKEGLILLGIIIAAAAVGVWLWKTQLIPPCEVPQNTGASRIDEVPLPKGYERAPIQVDSYGEYLRELPLKASNDLYLYNDSLRKNQCSHYGIVDVDRGERDLQQCADAVMRLRAEYLREKNRTSEIHFNFTSGDSASWEQWRAGWRVNVSPRDKVTWNKTASYDDSYANFRRYLEVVFAYAGTASLEQELVPVQPEDMEIGDVFIYGGHPGHAMMVADMAINPKNGKKLFLLIQGNTPAMDIHILKNTKNPKLNPWYPVDFGSQLKVPGSSFYASDLMRFK